MVASTPVCRKNTMPPSSSLSVLSRRDDTHMTLCDLVLASVCRQVDANFTYAYTLCGHEFVASEKIDKARSRAWLKGTVAVRRTCLQLKVLLTEEFPCQAVAMYENALNLDPRHYNAWHGPYESQAGRGQRYHARWGLGNIYHRQEEHEFLGRHCESLLLP